VSLTDVKDGVMVRRVVVGRLLEGERIAERREALVFMARRLAELEKEIDTLMEVAQQ